MTSIDPEDPLPPADLTARVFRALYDQFDLHITDGTHIAVPRGTPCFAAPTISEVARQISDREHRVPGPPDAVHRVGEPRRTLTEDS
jgi:hypothetical protein